MTRSNPEIKFWYINHEGDKEERHVLFISLKFITAINNDYGYQPGWYFDAWDLKRKAVRTFALSRVMLTFDLQTQQDPTYRLLNFGFPTAGETMNK